MGASGYEKPNLVVQLTRARVARVAEPSDDRCVALAEVASPDFFAKYATSDALLREDRNEPERAAQLAEIDARWRWVGATDAGYAGYLRSMRATTTLWGFLRVQDARVINAMFFIFKKDHVHLRKIIACCPFNARVGDGGECPLPGPWHTGRVRFLSKRFFIAEGDVESAFTRVRMPMWMWAWLCLLPVPVDSLMTDDEKRAGRMECPLTGLAFKSGEFVCPAYTRLPMGFAHGVQIMLHVMSRSTAQAMGADE